MEAREHEPVPMIVYWQRRALVGLVALALVAAVVAGVTAWRNRAATAAQPSAESTPTQPATTEPTPAAEPTQAAEPGPVTCDVAQLVLRLSGPARVKAGQHANLVVTFTNVGTHPCRLPLTKETFRLTVTSGTDEIWSSTDCDGWGPDGTADVAAGGTHEWTTTWQRHRSNGCRVVPGDLAAGTYVATATWQGGPSTRHVMLLVW